ncbi:HesA/MoeB/ThiF family protein [Chryseobacterium wangxinyae]|uniref:HesA/MoeB/ThiF family protein n=1 Tax=Chryseobacterium sp. CY353 TaxID=2997334 RepID=UPI002270543D|nr:HesA/MoeB/ThiF family protein [Chryseobacterium sp. CY353]MCY0970145.1 HesA/MoeB/ThiF family protein [Chryseobacterium sp. CY353]
MEKYNERYARHYALSDFGFEGQQKLMKAKVLVIGAGGLGCPVLQYLSAAGIGVLGIVDHDHVSLSNLQRQTLYTTDDIGKQKSEVAASRLALMNPENEIVNYSIELTSNNAWKIISEYDIVVDCTDNFAARYLINDACVLLNKPLIFGAIYKYEGQVAVFNLSSEKNHRVNYRHLFPEPPKPDDVQNCNDVGVLGVLPGMIGMMQANEVIKIITGLGEVLDGKILTFNMLTYETYILDISIEQSAENLIPNNRKTFEATNYSILCGISKTNINDLSLDHFTAMISFDDTSTIDVREPNELPAVDFKHIQIPLSQIDERLSELKNFNIVLFCQSGKRSLKAAEILMNHFGDTKKISHLKGGITAFKQEKNEQKD